VGKSKSVPSGGVCEGSLSAGGGKGFMKESPVEKPGSCGKLFDEKGDAAEGVFGASLSRLERGHKGRGGVGDLRSCKRVPAKKGGRVNIYREDR